MRILVIEKEGRDGASIGAAVRRCEKPTEVVVATTAREGLARARRQRFDAVLLDTGSPGIDALYLLREIRRRRKSPAILMITRLDDEELAGTYIADGAQDVLLRDELEPRRLQRALTNARHRQRVSAALRHRYETARALAEQDALTGLSNRRFFDASLRAAMQSARRHGSPLALLLLDIDNFKRVNDTYGHDAGDLVLKKVARRLFEALRAGDLLCRLGGDEFAVLAHHFDSEPQSFLFGQRLLRALQHPFRINGIDIRCTASIGIVCYPSSAASPEELMKQADLAMYKSKKGGRNRASFFSEALNAQASRRVALEHDLRIALQKNELELHFQPELGGASEQVVAAEAFLRWRHPQHGLLTPGAFLSVAEETGLIVPIGTWVLQEACRQAQRWREAEKGPTPAPRVAVNISGVQLRSYSIVRWLEVALGASSLPPEQVELEITESALALATSDARRVIARLSALGARIALDNFGRGPASLAPLRTLPFQVLKLDRSILHPAVPDRRARHLLPSVLAMGRNLELETVAAGIETEEDARLARRHRADRLQGFLFSPALPAEEFQMFWHVRSAQANGARSGPRGGRSGSRSPRRQSDSADPLAIG